ncbi:MAG TPA: hypothetical protein VIV14_06225 [Gammaproteobacteria bacterium]
MSHRTWLRFSSAAAGVVLLFHGGISGAQIPLATGEYADVTDEGLHRVHPELMEAAWVKPDLDLTRYSRVLLMPTAVQFRDVPGQTFNARTRIEADAFPVEESRKEWITRVWRDAVNERFGKETSYELFPGIADDVLVVQGFLVDVVSKIPPDDVGSSYAFVQDPWEASVVLELRDAMTGEMLARTMDRRLAQGLLDHASVWILTEDLIKRWAEVLHQRLEQLVDLQGPSGANTPEFAR